MAIWIMAGAGRSMAPASRVFAPLSPDLRRRASGTHDEHFLTRLERIALPEVEVALALYRDPELVRTLLRPTRIPEGVPRVAISLDDPRDGPFLIVARNGHFITCLAQGMQTELPVVTRQELESLSGWVGAQRASRQEIRQAQAEAGRLLSRILKAGDSLTREEFATLARWQPLYLPEFWRLLVRVTRHYSDYWHLLFHPWRDLCTAKFESALYGLWRIGWGASHLAVLVALYPEILAELVEHESDLLTLTTWATFRQGRICTMLRGCWAAARLGRVVVAGYARQLAQPINLQGLWDAWSALTTIGLRHPDLGAEIDLLLQRPIEIDGEPALAQHARVWLQHILKAYPDHREIYRRADLDIGAQVGVALTDHHPPDVRHRYTGLEQVPPELALPLAANYEGDPLNLAKDREIFFNLLPLAAEVRAEDLYLPADFLACTTTGWRRERSEVTNRQLRQHLELDQPIRVTRTPGRNELCPCGSGKKYKRCCGA